MNLKNNMREYLKKIIGTIYTVVVVVVNVISLAPSLFESADSIAPPKISCKCIMPVTRVIKCAINALIVSHILENVVY